MAAPENNPGDNPQDTPPVAQDSVERVSKIPDKGNAPTKDIHTQANRIMKQKRGRPKKEAGVEVSRTTAWRRQQEEQGVLI